MRLLCLLALAAAVLLLAACGGGSSSSGSTAAEQAEDPFAELRFVLDKFPYEPWYRDCILARVEDKLSAAELEELAELPQEQGRRVALRFALGAAPSTAASAQVRPGTVRWATTATAAAVRKTRPIESQASGRITARSSCGEVRQPAA